MTSELSTRSDYSNDLIRHISVMECDPLHWLIIRIRTLSAISIWRIRIVPNTKPSSQRN